ncbi:protein kintoun isoform X2 [Parambassis ranga]|uniref:Protein kintoun n=1 Tax=Parambassis ranga TaxID=210632 RepID=A0A6P7HJA4_9TELE|nr:protein kintoun isoform X2 [Parambassis ranga]
MEVGDKLKELNMTADEIDRFTKAFKDEKFREMLRNYADEISDPENRKKYEEEIKTLEQERGNSIEFIHPTPFMAFKTSVDGKQKCFINICASEKVGKPVCKCVTEDGRRGQCWSLPHSLHPGRQDVDPKGNKVIIYDVVFHPDTLHIAGKNKRFMDMVESTATQGIQDAFKVTLDKNNMRQLRTKYKGTPQPCVTRKPIPGYTPKKPSEEPDLLAFQYPDEKRSTTVAQTKSTESPLTEHSSNTQPNSIPTQPQKPKEPTKPKYTVKYRSFIDLQDFRCSRDSAQSPRPKAIVVTIDMPLLKSVTDTCLEVREKTLLLESKKPAYRLELPLAYPVDEDKGEAKFNKQRGQLTVTLPVLPSNLSPDLFVMSASEFDSVDDSEGKDEESGAEKEDKGDVTEHKEQEGRVETGKEEKEDEKCDSAEIEGSVEEGGVKQNDKNPVSEVWEEKQKHEEEVTKQDDQNDNREISDDSREDRNAENSFLQCDTSVQEENLVSVNDGGLTSPTINENQANLMSSLEPTPKRSLTDVQEETKANLQENTQVGTDAACQRHTSSDDSPITTSNASQDDVEESCARSNETPAATDDARKSGGGDFDKQLVLSSDEAVVTDKDNPPTGQTCLTSECDNKTPPVLLREIDKDGNETVISDHSTSAGFTFHNTLMFELD